MRLFTLAIALLPSLALAEQTITATDYKKPDGWCTEYLGRSQFDMPPDTVWHLYVPYDHSIDYEPEDKRRKGEKETDSFYALSLAVNKSVPFSPVPFSNASASANVLPDALYYYSPTAQAQLHAAKPDTYPETPPFSISSKRVTNPPGVSDADYRFYKN